MGVEHQQRFRREKVYPGGRSVLAVGRLVEKKGFRHLLDAAGLMAADAPLERLRILGDGPLRAELEEHAAALGLGEVVEWLGARTAGGVREALEEADVLVVSAVFVDDGDRDVLPLVVGEALAMEVPVIASDMVGLPEVVMQPWGMVVPPGDARALADALATLLALPAGERAARGRSGREFVVATRDLETEAHKLADLIRAAGRP
jgi:glycosyltransferase involved in cell wall biosynthesis